MIDEIVATFEHEGRSYEVDHLGIAVASQWGEFAVYSSRQQVAEFTVDQAMLRPAHRTGLPSVEELIVLAKAALEEAY